MKSKIHHSGNWRAKSVSIVTLGLLLWFFVGLAAESQDFDVGLMAYKEGDYTTALQKFKSLAKSGDIRAQYYLGEMYRRGDGVTKDYREAVNWWRLAAVQGDIWAQYMLGVTYYFGADGVPADHIVALAWLDLVVAQGIKDARPLWHSLQAQLTPAEVEEAKGLARNWQ
ncbi:MAG: tetratricopeptide repeat protein [Rhodobacteraceae bacterium]|nr:tetratricopeptide repeat protein [Paracoccaceae bacterium]